VLEKLHENKLKIILARFGGVRFSDFKQGNPPSETKPNHPTK